MTTSHPPFTLLAGKAVRRVRFGRLFRVLAGDRELSTSSELRRQQTLIIFLIEIERFRKLGEGVLGRGVRDQREHCNWGGAGIDRICEIGLGGRERGSRACFGAGVSLDSTVILHSW